MFDTRSPQLKEKTIDIPEDIDLLRINMPSGKIIRIHKVRGENGECRINWTGELKISGSIVAS